MLFVCKRIEAFFKSPSIFVVLVGTRLVVVVAIASVVFVLVTFPIAMVVVIVFLSIHGVS